MNHMLNRWTRVLLGFSLVALPLGVQSATVTNVYFTGFETNEAPGAYDPYYELVGQQGWLRYPAVFGGNGLITNFLGSQAAYIGLFPTDPKTNTLSIFRHIDYTPPANARTLVKFSVTMDIEDSYERRYYDDFWWTLYNAWGDSLFTLEFDNKTWAISYGLDNGIFYETGQRFTNGLVYQLMVTMDFQSNRWSAVISNEYKATLLATNQLITTKNTPLNFGSMDLIWRPKDPKNPGDNFLIFDNYRVVAEIQDTRPVYFLTLGKPSGSSFPLRLTGPDGQRFAIDVSANLSSWTPLKTNTITDGSFDFVDQNPGSAPRFFRARLVN